MTRVPKDRSGRRPPMRPGTRRGMRTGLTLMEFLLAIVITGVIATVVAMMLYSVWYGTSSQTELRSVLVRHETVATRLNAALRSSTMVLAKGDDYVVLWMAEHRAFGVPNLSELMRIERDAATQELRSYEAPDDLAEADDVEYELATTDFNAVTNALKGTAFLPCEVWTSELTGWTIVLDAADPRESRFVSYRMTLTSDDVSETAVAGMALRNR